MARRPPADTPAAAPAGGLRRVIVERVEPEIDAGRFPIKRIAGDQVFVTADVFADGHDLLAGVLRYRRTPANEGIRNQELGPRADSGTRGQARGGEGGGWHEVPLALLDNDRWGASFTLPEIGRYEYTVEAWIDRFGSWLKALVIKAEAGQDVSSELLEGAALVEAAADREPVVPAQAAKRPARRPATRARPATSAATEAATPGARLRMIADRLRGNAPQATRVDQAREPELRALMDARPDRSLSTVYARTLAVVVDPVRARFGAWYEMFPRSYTPDPSRSATLREAEARLPAIAAMGFDVVYLPPVHPIGQTHRKGRNNTLTAEPGDPGSPWAIGSEAGGHTAIEPGLGTIEDFDRFVATANGLGLDVALDIAFQASPDHPWVREHPEWFRHRPDGTIKYAENPPKRYQDIYPLDFESPDWRGLWEALRDVFRFWIGHGVTIFRVDNPHTKSFAFWEWCIGSLKRDHPETIFLSEAFTRPKVMRYLAKAGFTQSYTYFTWRNSADDLRDYLTELTTTEVLEYLRPNFFANTPDILHAYLQDGGRPAFEVRFILAATLGASYGIYSGFELCEHVAVRPGSEEYLDSEKYQIKVRDWDQPGNLTALITRVNQIRADHPALQQDATLAFHPTDNPAILWYTKTAGDDRVLVAANTDPHWMQHGWLELPIETLGLRPGSTVVVEDLLDGTEYLWRDGWNYVRLDPAERMAHVFAVKTPSSTRGAP